VVTPPYGTAVDSSQKRRRGSPAASVGFVCVPLLFPFFDGFHCGSDDLLRPRFSLL